MPTYEYRCGACGHRFDVFQKISEPPIRTCPECGKDEAERLISAGGGVVFKGSGFYATDYRKDGPGRSGDAGGDAKGSGDGSSGGSKKEATGGDSSSSGGDGE